MNYKELEKQEKLKNVYVLKGDAFLCQQAKNQIIAKLNIDKINISEFNDENFDVNNIVNSCNQFSFFAENRLVCVESKLKDLTKQEQKTLQDYVDNPNQNCILLFIDDLGSKNFDFLKNIEIIECKVNDIFLTSYVKSEFEKQNKQIENINIKKLCDYCLNNLTRINLEIKKICDYMQSQTEVSGEIIDLLVFKDMEQQVFALTDALGYKNKTKALSTVNQMLSSGESPIKILGLINGQFRRMMFAKINKGSNQELANALGCKEYAITKAKEQANRFSASSLKKVLNLLLETDFNIKDGQMAQENALYYLVLSILDMQ